MELYGNGRIVYEDITLEAAYIRYEIDNNTVEAIGKPDSAGVIIGNPVITDENIFGTVALVDVESAQCACGLSGCSAIILRKIRSAASVCPWYTRLLARFCRKGGWSGKSVFARL